MRVLGNAAISLDGRIAIPGGAGRGSGSLGRGEAWQEEQHEEDRAPPHRAPVEHGNVAADGMDSAWAEIAALPR